MRFVGGGEDGFVRGIGGIIGREVFCGGRKLKLSELRFGDSISKLFFVSVGFLVEFCLGFLFGFCVVSGN